MNKLAKISFVFLFCQPAFAKTPILADVQTLQKLKIPMIEQSSDLGIGFAQVSDVDRDRISKLTHENGACGGYQIVNAVSPKKLFAEFTPLFEREKIYRTKKALMSQLPGPKVTLTQFDPKIRDAVKLVTEELVGEWIMWLANFGGRFHAAADPNIHTQALVVKLESMISALNFPAKVDLVTHSSTKQKSVRLRLEGSLRPQEIVVLGGHLDSVNWSGGDKNNAPGADDNASGSGALLEALSIIVKQGQPERSIEFMWYAGEEAGLLGSTEIADNYKAQNKDVVAVLQLDMTLHPGSGELTISSVSDFTSAWLRDMLLEFNSNYLNINIIDDKCGYACSDHASWYRKGYPTLMPFESHTRQMNSKIHSPQDVVNTASSMKHAAVFSKIAVIFGMTLANSNLRQP